MSTSNHLDIILASSSPYRKQLLANLGLVFKTHSPNIDETPLLNELPDALVKRLAKEKALKVSEHHPLAVIIASDQIALHEGKILGKPKTRDKAIEQLMSFQGKEVQFLTSLAVYHGPTKKMQIEIDTVSVTFKCRTLSDIEHYVDSEKPLDCAGSFKSEGLGITLFESLHCSDPNSLIGLPLIKLTTLLENVGIPYSVFGAKL